MGLQSPPCERFSARGRKVYARRRESVSGARTCAGWNSAGISTPHPNQCGRSRFYSVTEKRNRFGKSGTVCSVHYLCKHAGPTRALARCRKYTNQARRQRPALRLPGPGNPLCFLPIQLLNLPRCAGRIYAGNPYCAPNAIEVSGCKGQTVRSTNDLLDIAL